MEKLNWCQVRKEEERESGRNRDVTVGDRGRDGKNGEKMGKEKTERIKKGKGEMGKGAWRLRTDFT